MKKLITSALVFVLVVGAFVAFAIYSNQPEVAARNAIINVVGDLFERDEIKSATCLLPRGSIMPATSLRANMNKIISSNGEIIVATSIKRPVAPTAFLIKFDDARIIPIPSLKYEPRIGT